MDASSSRREELHEPKTGFSLNENVKVVLADRLYSICIGQNKASTSHSLLFRKSAEDARGLHEQRGDF